MNHFQTKLYNDLMNLCLEEGQEAFYFVDQVRLGRTYRIFLYRMASYSEFLKPGALECRGHTFLLDTDDAKSPEALVSMPMNKFFNHGENPFVMGLDLGTIVHVMDKLDGSLISTVRSHDNDFFLKSKGSLNSEQAQAATRLLNTPEYSKLKSFCYILATTGFTVNMEYMAPDNRIVIGYAKPTLKVLNIRNNTSGDYLNVHDSLLGMDEFIVASHPLPEDGEKWLADTYKSDANIEGFVAMLSCGTWFKVKTEKYCALHHTKDSITIPRRLFEACVNGGADDLRAMFSTDEVAVMQINEMDEKVRSIYNRLHLNVYAFHASWKGEDRKTYAIAGQNDPVVQADGTFGLVMNLYLEKGANIEEFMIKNYKKYGIKDEAPVESDV